MELALSQSSHPGHGAGAELAEVLEFHGGAGTNCGFSTYEQCMTTARGSSGYCNNLYVAPHPAISSGHATHKPGAKLKPKIVVKMVRPS
jgi:hypothetical protein